MVKKMPSSSPAKNTPPVKLSHSELVQLFELQQSQLESVRQQSSALRAALQDIMVAETALKELQSYSEKDPTMVSLGAGLFVNAELKNVKQLLSNYGNNVFAEISLADALKKLDVRKKEISSSISEVQQQEVHVLQSLSGMERMLVETQRIQQQNGRDTGPPIVS